MKNSPLIGWCLGGFSSWNSYFFQLDIQILETEHNSQEFNSKQEKKSFGTIGRIGRSLDLIIINVTINIKFSLKWKSVRPFSLHYINNPVSYPKWMTSRHTVQTKKPDTQRKCVSNTFLQLYELAWCLHYRLHATRRNI